MEPNPDSKNRKSKAKSWRKKNRSKVPGDEEGTLDHPIKRYKVNQYDSVDHEDLIPFYLKDNNNSPHGLNNNKPGTNSSHYNANLFNNSGSCNSSNRSFSRHVLQHVVCELCRYSGFSSIQPMALEVLVGVLESYIQKVGEQAHLSADLVGRNQCNVYDLYIGLIGLGINVKSLKRYLRENPESPFETAIPNFPLTARKRNVNQSLAQSTRQQPAHIPNYLPPFPPDHTYIDSPIYEKRNTSESANRSMIALQRRQVEEGLSRFFAKTKLLVSKDVRAKAQGKKIPLNPVIAEVKGQSNRNILSMSLQATNSLDVSDVNVNDDDAVCSTTATTSSATSSKDKESEAGLAS